MARYYVRCKVEDVMHKNLASWDWTRCEDRRMVEARFDHKDNALAFASIIGTHGIDYLWGEVK